MVSEIFKERLMDGQGTNRQQLLWAPSGKPEVQYGIVGSQVGESTQKTKQFLKSIIIKCNLSKIPKYSLLSPLLCLKMARKLRKAGFDHYGGVREG